MIENQLEFSFSLVRGLFIASKPIEKMSQGNHLQWKKAGNYILWSWIGNYFGREMQNNCLFFVIKLNFFYVAVMLCSSAVVQSDRWVVFFFSCFSVHYFPLKFKGQLNRLGSFVAGDESLFPNWPVSRDMEFKTQLSLLWDLFENIS